MADPVVRRKSNSELEERLAALESQLGTQYTLSISEAGLTSTQRAVAVVYQTTDGTWRFRFNIRFTTTSTSSCTVIISGVTFKNIVGFQQAISASVSGSARDKAAGNTVPGTGNLAVIGDNGPIMSDVRISGDVELDSKPAFVP